MQSPQALLPPPECRPPPALPTWRLCYVERRVRVCGPGRVLRAFTSSCANTPPLAAEAYLLQT